MVNRFTSRLEVGGITHEIVKLCQWSCPANAYRTAGSQTSKMSNKGRQRVTQARAHHSSIEIDETANVGHVPMVLRTVRVTAAATRVAMSVATLGCTKGLVEPL